MVYRRCIQFHQLLLQKPRNLNLKCSITTLFHEKLIDLERWLPLPFAPTTPPCSQWPSKVSAHPPQLEEKEDHNLLLVIWGLTWLAGSIVGSSDGDARLAVLADLLQRLLGRHLPPVHYQCVYFLICFDLNSNSHKPGLLGEVVDLELLLVLLEDSTLLYWSQQGLSSLAGHVVQLGVQPSGKLVLEENIEEWS